MVGAVTLTYLFAKEEGNSPSQEQTMKHHDITSIEMYRIELEARRMRAESVRRMFASLGRLIARGFSGVFAPRGTGRTA